MTAKPSVPAWKHPVQLFSCFHAVHPAALKTKQCCIFGSAPVGSNVGLCCHWDGTFYNVAVGPLSLIDQSHSDFMKGLTSSVKMPHSTQLFLRAMFAGPKCVQTLASLWLPNADKSLFISYCLVKLQFRHLHLIKLITKEHIYLLRAEICVSVVRRTSTTSIFGGLNRLIMRDKLIQQQS